MNILTSIVNSYQRIGNVTKCISTITLQISKPDSEVPYLKSIKAIGEAVCSSDDVYDWEFGKILSRTRAGQKCTKKLEKELIKYSYKNSRGKSHKYTAHDFRHDVSWVKSNMDESILSPDECTLILEIEKVLLNKGVISNDK